MRPLMPEGKNSLLLGIIFSALGVGLTLLGLLLSAPRLLLVATGEVAQGVVVELKSGSKGSVRSVVEFKPKGKKKTRVTASVGNASPLQAVGEVVNVYYDRDDPSNALIDTFIEVWFYIVLIDGMGVTWLAIGLPFFFVGLSRKNARDRVLREGLHATGTVVDVIRTMVKNTVRYEPIVEARDPVSGALARFPGEEGYDANLQGRAATIHMEPAPPHRYFIDLR